MELKHRALIYRAAVVIGIGLLVFGVVTENNVVVALGLLESLLGNTVSSIYTPWKSKTSEVE